jgi:dihydroorotase
MLGLAESTATLIENARWIDPAQNLDRVGRLLIHHGVIAAIDPTEDALPPELQRIDASGWIGAPGLIDLGSELGEPGREEDETIAAGTMAALAGGYTSIACTANTEPPIDTAAAVEFVRQKAMRSDRCRVHVIGCVSKHRQGKELAEIGSLVEAGAVAFSDAPGPLENTALLRRALEYCLMFDRPVFDHPEIKSLAEGGIMHEGLVQLVLGLAPIPAEAEDLATARDLRLVESTGGRLHLTNISTVGSVELVRRAKDRGLKSTCGVTPANFCFTDAALRSFDSNLKLQPPLRSEEHVAACLQGLRDDTIDAITSGHRPCALEKKMQELDLAPFGASTLETTLASVITYLIRPGVLSWMQAIDKLSTSPARILGVEGGSLKIGMPADVVLIDPEHRWVVQPGAMLSRSKNSYFSGHELFGCARMVWVGGVRKYVAPLQS